MAKVVRNSWPPVPRIAQAGRRMADRALFIAAGQTRLTIQVAATGPLSAALLKVSGLDQIATVVTLN